MLEYETVITDLALPTPDREIFPNGFLLFDQQVQHIKAWVAFKQSPDIQTLEWQMNELGAERLNILDQARLWELQSTQQVLRLNSDLAKARNSSEQAKLLHQNTASPKGILYRVVRFISLPLAERIIPYETSYGEVLDILANRKEIIRGQKDIQGDTVYKISLVRAQQNLAEREFQGITGQWIFKSLERTLFHALTYFGDPQERNRLFLGYTRSVGGVLAEIEEAYSDLLKKATPSHYQDYSVMNDTNGVAEYSKLDQIQENVALKKFDSGEWQKVVRGPEDEGLQRKVIIDNCSGAVCLFHEVSEADFEAIVRKSGTPLTSGQIKSTIRDLANSEDPIGKYQRYPNTVHTGDYTGFHVVKKGRKGRIIFKYCKDGVIVRFGDYYKVYADVKKWMG